MHGYTDASSAANTDDRWLASGYLGRCAGGSSVSIPSLFAPASHSMLPTRSIEFPSLLCAQ